MVTRRPRTAATPVVCAVSARYLAVSAHPTKLVSASFQEHLELALGDEYRVERELGGGGMSRVFLATQVDLGRKVVIKVLTPELAAGVNRERFRREVQMAATLQHPLIVPVLTAGEAEGLLWYTMPFVEGESLRERLHRGVLSAKEATTALADVARALGAAHRKGIVHRDIKPGNILLHEHNAVVADFGVAKALTAATAESTGLTTSGLAVGTPAYMSPEQAAGDAAIDARSDIYALGCVAYELLSGKPPFVDPSAARLLVAQVSLIPVPLSQVAPVSPALSAIVMRCLEKDPDDRWPTADALADAFDQQRYTGEVTPFPEPRARLTGDQTTQAAPAKPAAPSHRGRKRVAGFGALVAIAVAVGTAMFSSKQGPRNAVAFVAPQTVLVADVENRTADSTLGDLLSEALRTELQQSKIVTVMTPAATTAALSRMQRPAVSRINAELAREIAQREGVPLVVEGRLQKVGNTFLVRAALVSPTDGAERSAAQETAASEDELIAAIGRLARRTREALGESGTTLTALAPMEQVTTRSLDALRKYSEAIRLGDAPNASGNREKEIALLEEAVALDSTFAMAWRRLGMRMRGGGPPSGDDSRRRADAAIERAYALRDRLSPVERGLTEASYFSTNDRDIGKAQAAYLAILKEQPNNRIALNNLANTAQQDGDFEKVREYGARYVAVDSMNAQAWPWLVWGNYGTGRTSEARLARAEMHRRFTSADEVKDLDRLDLEWLLFERDYPAVERLARRMLTSSTDTRADNLTLSMLGLALMSRGKLEEWWKFGDSVAIERVASRDTTEARIWRGDGIMERLTDRAWYANDTTGGRAALVEYLRVSGAERWRMQDRSEFNFADKFVLVGDARVARERLNAYRAAALRDKDGGALLPANSPQYAAVEAPLLILEGKPQEALKRITPLLASTRSNRFGVSSKFVVGSVYAANNQPDSARVWLSLLLESKDPRNVWQLLMVRPRALRLLCEIADTPARRAESCGVLADEWENADAVLQPVVARARARLAER
jgi:eukaryotic-like serine/threonine-protein kinase